MLEVALTGGIGTGKSYVLARVAAHGIPTIDSDRVVHELLGPRTPVSAAVAAEFGASVLCDDGGVNRRALARLVFADEPARRALERIVHPAVFERIAAWARARAGGGARWALADVPLLFESHHEADFALVVVAACSPELQIQRVMARDAVTEDEARARLAAQWPIEEKIRRADYVIQTGGSFEDTNRQVDDVIGRIESKEIGTRE